MFLEASDITISLYNTHITAAKTRKNKTTHAISGYVTIELQHVATNY